MTSPDQPIDPWSASWGLDTALIHTAQDPDPATGAVVVPIYATSTFAREHVADQPRFGYSRQANPTRAVLEAVLARIERGVGATAFASGMAAISAAAQLLASGDHAVVTPDCYMGTYRLFTRNMRRAGVETDFVDMTDLEAVQRAVRPGQTRMLWMETPSNPRLRITDIAAVVAIARELGAWTVLDNTVASPYCQNPIDFGVDLVVHSTTKYLGGHSDLLGGAVIARTPELAAQIADQLYTLGAVPSAFDCWLLLRGMKTLGVRMRQHLANAQRVAEWLVAHPKVQCVHYPGLPSHPDYALGRRQMPGGPSGLLSFEVAGGDAAATTVVERVKIFAFAASLGGVESLITAPSAAIAASPEHAAQLEGSMWAATPGLVRLSLGIESVDDLIADLDQALAAVPG